MTVLFLSLPSLAVLGCKGKLSVGFGVGEKKKSDVVEAAPEPTGGESQPPTAALDTEPPVPGSTGSLQTSVNGQSVTISWAAATDNATPTDELRYLLVYSTVVPITATDSAFTTLGDYAPSLARIIDFENKDSTYHMNVIVRDAAGNRTIYKGTSVTVKATTPPGPDPTGEPPADSTPPGAGELKLFGIGFDWIQASWMHGSDETDKKEDLEYYLCRSVNPGSVNTVTGCLAAEKVLDWSKDLRTATDINLSTAVNHHYNILVRDQSGNTAAGTPASATTLGIRKQIASLDFSGNTGSCFIASTGELYCALPRSTPFEKVGTDTDWAKVYIDSSRRCAIKTNKSLYCAGTNSVGQVGDGTTVDKEQLTQIGTDTDWESIKIAGNLTCGMKSNDSIYCWGLNTNGQIGNGDTQNKSSPTASGGDTDWESMDTSGTTTCAVKTNGTLWCWGRNTTGTVGDGTTVSKSSPVQITSATDWASVYTGFRTCALKDSGAVYCWGYSGITSPQQVGTDTGFSTLSLGSGHICGLRNGGELYCWGTSASGGLGAGSATTSSTTPLRIGTDNDWTQVVAVNNTTCGIRSGELYCWGSNSSGQVGDGAFANVFAPKRVGSRTDWQQIIGKQTNICAFDTLNQIYCWGANLHGYIPGSYAGGKHRTPFVNDSTSDWTRISSGWQHNCGVKKDGTYCWGLNITGEVGDGTFTASSAPKKIDPETNWRSLHAYYGYSCGIKSDKKMYCWGDKDYLSNPLTAESQVPALASSDADWNKLAVGLSLNHGCGIKDSGALFCWGYNNNGQLGDGTTINDGIPKQIGTDTDWAEVAAVFEHTCAIKKDGSLYCWGQNADGQLGDGTTTDRHTPTRIGTDNDWKSLGPGWDHTCAIKTDGALYCWGNNTSGEVGNGTNTDQTSPALIGSGFSKVEGGAQHTCALKLNGDLYCWGGGYDYTLGNGIAANSNVPVQVPGKWDDFTAGEMHNCGLRAGTPLCWGENSDWQSGGGLMINQRVPVKIAAP